MTNKIGLKNEYTNVITNDLNRLLSNYQIYYQNLRGFHWNITGKSFFQLHNVFEGYYDNAAEVIDEIAERILMLDNTPLHSYPDYIENATLKIHKDITKAEDAVKLIINDMTTLLTNIRETIDKADAENDEGTINLLTDQINYFEKNLWMLNSWLS